MVEHRLHLLSLKGIENTLATAFCTTRGFEQFSIKKNTTIVAIVQARYCMTMAQNTVAQSNFFRKGCTWGINYT